MPDTEPRRPEARRPEALFARQLRLNQEEHDALNQAAEHGKQNTFIRAALRAALVRRGLLERAPRG